MKRAILFFTLLLIGFASCKKDDDNTPSKPSYHINGISEITLQKAANNLQPVFTYMSLEVVYEHSDQEKITLSLEGLPQGLAAMFYANSGIPSFTTSLQLTDSGIAVGTYPLTLVATGASSGRRTYPFNVSILAAPDCAQEIVGNGYTTQNFCSSSGTYTQNITKVAGEPGRVLFSNFDNAGGQVYGLVSCSSGEISIPSQTVNGVAYQGGGSYWKSGTQRVISISYIRNTSSCNMQLIL